MNAAPPLADQAIAIARWAEARGWKPTPLHIVGPDGTTCSCPKGASCGGSAGKHNIAANWQRDLRGAEIFVEMASGAPRPSGGHYPQRKRMNVGILTGEPSGIFVLDIDPKDGGFDSMKALVAEHGPLPRTFIVRTGSGGYHYYFQMPDFDARNSAAKIAPGIDIRGNGGMVVGPGSVSHAGAYTIQFDALPAIAPEWLLDAIRPAAPSASPTYVGSSQNAEAVRPVDPFANGAANAFDATPATSGGEVTRASAAYESSIITGELRRLAQLRAEGWNGQPWDITTFQVACQLIELANAPWSRLTVDEAHQQFMQHCPPAEVGYDPAAKWTSALNTIGDKARPAPAPSNHSVSSAFEGWEASEPDPTVAAGADREGAPAAGPFGFSDLGNAERLVAWHGGILRYAADAQAWLTYDRGVWDDTAGEVDVEAFVKSAMVLAREHEFWLHSDQIQDVEAKNPKSDRDDFVSWCGKTEMYSKVTAAVKMARSDARLRVGLGVFDADPMMFNAANCAVNLATGERVEHHPSQMFRHQSRIAYVPDAACPLWEKFLERTQPDPQMRAWLQQVLGYSITGRMDEHAIFLHNGPGATGKTTFLEVIKEVMGNYGQKLDRETLLSKPSGSSGGASASPDVARMAGARFLAASETATGRKLDDERVKELVGGDTQTARHLFGKPFEFKPTGKIHMATNHLPGFESGGDGMGRRLRLVPWEVIIPVAERDKTLADRIIATEAEGVLAWLVRGAVAWAASGGLVTPGEVQKRSDEHIEQADPIWPFIHERLEVGDGYETEFQAIYGAYDSWSNLNGNKPMSGRAFSMALRERLGADSKFLHPDSRRSMFRVKVRMMAVPAHHEQYATGMR